MKRGLFVGLLAVLFLWLSGFSSSPKTTLEGSWIGEFKNGTETRSFVVHFVKDDGQLTGVIDIPKEGVYGMALDWIMIDSSSVHFELVRDCGTCVFDGQLRSGRVVGDYLTTANKGTFYMISAAVAMH